MVHQQEPDPSAELALNDEIVALFAGMEQRRNAKAARRRNPRGATAATPANALPEQEDAASRAAQRERARVRRRCDARYGAHATEVRNLEAALNRSFDRVSRVQNPPLWPSVSLMHARG